MAIVNVLYTFAVGLIYYEMTYLHDVSVVKCIIPTHTKFRIVHGLQDFFKCY